jgi:hypothetical protein
MNDGAVQVGTDLIVKQGLSEAAFLATAVGSACVLRAKSGDRAVHESRGPLDVVGRKFHVAFHFSKGLIQQMHLNHASSAPNKGWTLDAEPDERSAVVGNWKWLQSVYGAPPPYTFPWGRAEAFYDEKTGCNAVSIYYY